MATPRTSPTAPDLRPRLWCALTVAVAAVTIGLGIGPRLKSLDGADSAAWRIRVAPVAEAPIPSGSRVTFILPPPSNEVFPRAYRYEAAWLRPDLYWRDAVAWPPEVGQEWAVTLGAADPRDGWDVVWTGGEVTVLRRPP